MSDAIIVDDETYLAESVKAHLESRGHPQLSVREVFSQADLVPEYVQEQPVGLCVIDVKAGLEPALQVFRQSPEETKTLVFTREDTMAYFAPAWSAGVDGYALKQHSRKRFLRAVKKTMAGRRYAPRRLLTRYAEYLRTDELTPKQRQWAELFIEGKTAREIADILSVARKTVYQRKYRGKDKLGCDDDRDMREVLAQRLRQPFG